MYKFNDYKDTRNFKFLEIEEDIDLFRDGTIELITTPGHSIGHQAMIVRLENKGPICLGADNFHHQESYRSLISIRFDWNAEQKADSRMKLIAIENAGIPIYFTHDPNDFKAFPNNGEYADRLVTHRVTK